MRLLSEAKAVCEPEENIMPRNEIETEKLKKRQNKKAQTNWEIKAPSVFQCGKTLRQTLALPRELGCRRSSRKETPEIVAGTRTRYLGHYGFYSSFYAYFYTISILFLYYFNTISIQVSQLFLWLKMLLCVPACACPSAYLHGHMQNG